MLIKHKLIANTSIFTIAMVFILGILNFSISSLETDLDVVREIDKVDIQVLQFRRAEKDFLARKDLKYVTKFDVISKELSETIAKLKNDLIKLGSDTNEIDNLKKIIIGYETSFKDIVSSQQRIGLHSKDGLYGKLRDMVHKTEEAIAGQNYQILSQMLQLRRNEKDFMLRLNEKYVTKWKANADKFIQLVNSSQLTTSTKETIIDSISSYQSAFIDLVTEQKILGYTAKEGLQGKMRATIHQVDGVLKKLLSNNKTEITEHIDFMYLLAYSVFALVISISVGYAYYISNNIVSNIHHLKATMNHIIETKDLSLIVHSKSKDELGEMANTFNHMILSFKDLIVEVNHSVITLNTATHSLSRSIQTTNEGVDQQIQQTDMVATAVTEMTTTVEAIADNTNSAASKAESTSENAINGKDSVNQTIAKINELSTSLLTSEGVVQDLAKDAVTIGSVLDVIRGIADQTNLLALNAAIEAARAGEHGRGFAVVADEVRTLASRTQDSTQEIEKIIGSLQERTTKIVEHMTSCRIKGQESSDQASLAGGMLEEITQNIETIMEMSSTIATAIHEQTTVASEVNKHIVAIRDVSEQAGKGSQQNAMMSEELAHQAEALHDSVKQFKV